MKRQTELQPANDAESDDVRRKGTFQRTKAGNGYKIVVDGVGWLYTSKAALLAVVEGDAPSCVFSEIVDSE